MKYMLPTLSLLALLAMPVVSRAQVTPAPSLMNFQGRLAKPDGTPVADGTYSVRFSLWTAQSGGTEKWNQTINPISVRNGTFAVLLNVASPANLFDTNLWLELKIGANAPLTPRQQLVSVGYAMKANTVPDNSITNAKIVSVDWSKITNPPSSSLTLPYAGTANTITPAFKVTNSNALGSGIQGFGQPYGVYGEAKWQFAISDDAYGVYGKETSSGNYGYLGSNSFGVYGQSNYAAVYGVNTLNTNNIGMLATDSSGALGFSGSGHGVWGSTFAPGYAGVYGIGFGTSYGGYFYNPDGGVALYVRGTSTTDVLEIRGGADIAERFPVRGKVKAGMVVEIDPTRQGILRLAQGAYNPRIAGVVSGAKNLSAGVILTDPKTTTKNTLPIAMNGRVWVWCDASKRAIAPGCFLTSSDRPGYAMAAVRSSRAQGAILGKAMTRLPKGKTGLVLALVNLQ
jgi:hypothetical protein